MNLPPPDAAPKTGDLFVVSGRGWVGAAIRLFTRSRWTHAGVVVDDDGKTVEAWSQGAVRWHVEPGYSLIRLPVDEDTRQAIAAAALKLLGTPYGKLDIIYLALLTSGIHFKWLREKVARTDHLICSQLADQACLDAGLHLFTDGRFPQQVSPGAIGELAAKHGLFVGAADPSVNREYTVKTA